jgi:hypothetical protein
MAVRERAERTGGDHFRRDVALYTLARVVLVAVLATVLAVVKVPLLVAIAVALVAGFPLSLLLFRGLNQRVTAGLVERNRTKDDERKRLRAQLRGDDLQEPDPEV